MIFYDDRRVVAIDCGIKFRAVLVYCFRRGGVENELFLFEFSRFFFFVVSILLFVLFFEDEGYETIKLRNTNCFLLVAKLCLNKT